MRVGLSGRGSAITLIFKMPYRPTLNISNENLQSVISLEIVLLTVFFGVVYVLFFPFSQGDSSAPLVLRIAKYVLLMGASILVLDRLKSTKFQLIAVVFCSIYALLSIFNSQRDWALYMSSLACVVMSLILFLAPTNLSLKQRFESRFLFYLAFSCLVSIALLLVFPEAIVWRGDLKDDTPSISGLLDSPNRFGFLLLLGLSFTYAYRGWSSFLLGCLFVVAIPLTGSLGSVISAQLVIIFVCVWTVLIDRRNVWAYASSVCHSAFLLVTAYFFFSGSALFEHLFSTAPGHPTSNSITNRLSVVSSSKELRVDNVSELFFGWHGRADVDLFVFNVLQNGGLLALGLFLTLLACSVWKLVQSTRLSSVTPYLVAMVVLLDLIYNNNFWSFPFLLVSLLALKFYVFWDNVGVGASNTSDLKTGKV